MYSQGLRLFQNRGLHLLLSRPVALTTQRSQAFSIYNAESVRIHSHLMLQNYNNIIITERFLKEAQGR